MQKALRMVGNSLLFKNDSAVCLKARSPVPLFVSIVPTQHELSLSSPRTYWSILNARRYPQKPSVMSLLLWCHSLCTQRGVALH